MKLSGDFYIVIQCVRSNCVPSRTLLSGRRKEEQRPKDISIGDRRGERGGKDIVNSEVCGMRGTSVRETKTRRGSPRLA